MIIINIDKFDGRIGVNIQSRIHVVRTHHNRPGVRHAQFNQSKSISEFVFIGQCNPVASQLWRSNQHFYYLFLKQ